MKFSYFLVLVSISIALLAGRAVVCLAAEEACQLSGTGSIDSVQDQDLWNDGGEASFGLETPESHGLLYRSLHSLFSGFMLGGGYSIKQIMDWNLVEFNDPNSFWSGYLYNWSGDRVEIAMFSYNAHYRSAADYIFGLNNFQIKGIDSQQSFLNGFSQITGPLSISEQELSPAFPGIHVAPLFDVSNINKFFQGQSGYIFPGIMHFIFSPPALFAAFFLLQAYFFWRLSCRLGHKNAHLAWIPLANDFLAVKLSGRSCYWIFAMYVPLIGVFASVVLWRDIFHRLGLSGFFSLLMLIPVVNILILIALCLTLRPAENKQIGG